MSSRNRTLGGIAAVALLVVLFVLLRPSDDKPAATTTAPTTTEARTTTAPTTTAPTTTATPETVGFEIVVFDGKPVDGIQRISASKGEIVQIEVSRAAGEELHLHGYDKTLELGADGTGTLTFEATLQGVFVLELEHAGIQIAELTVR